MCGVVTLRTCDGSFTGLWHGGQAIIYGGKLVGPRWNHNQPKRGKLQLLRKDLIKNILDYFIVLWY